MNKTRRKAGFSLVEMLATVLIMSLVTLAIAAGMTVVRTSFKKITNKANAQVLLSTTETLLSNEFMYATEVEDESLDNNPKFKSGNSGAWISFISNGKNRDGSTREGLDNGMIYTCYYDVQLTKNEKGMITSSEIRESDSIDPMKLITDKAKTDELEVRFTKYSYDKDKGVFCIEDLAVYDNKNQKLAELTKPEGGHSYYYVQVVEGKLTPISADQAM